VEVLKRAISKHGKPAVIFTDRGTQFYATETDEKMKGLTMFEKYLIEDDIKQMLSRVGHPRTNGKIERFFRTVEDKRKFFTSIDELIEWYNMKRPHMSLNPDIIETPYQAYQRKMPGKDGVITDEESGEIYHAHKE
jgi:putative transposase